MKISKLPKTLNPQAICFAQIYLYIHIYEGERQGPDHACGPKPAVWSVVFVWSVFAVRFQYLFFKKHLGYNFRNFLKVTHKNVRKPISQLSAKAFGLNYYSKFLQITKLLRKSRLTIYKKIINSFWSFLEFEREIGPRFKITLVETALFLTTSSKIN